MNQILNGDCLQVLQGLPDNSVDAIVTDPPAGIFFMAGKNKHEHWDSDKGGRQQWIGWMESVARECLRVLKPGGHALVWAIPRTSHWTGLAWENAGWEPRDKIYHCFGSGFPKSLNLGNGWGTSLKPAIEEWWLFRKPISETNIAANVLRWGTGGINVDGARVEGIPPSVPNPSFNSPTGRIYGMKTGHGRNGQMSQATQGRFPAHLIHDGSEEVVGCFPESESRPAKYALNGKGVGHNGNKGSVLTGFGGSAAVGYNDTGSSAARFFKACPDTDPEDAETRRLVYQAKASKADRDEGLEEMPDKAPAFGNSAGDGLGRGISNTRQDWTRKNSHPTVKPTDLMRYLCRLITPPGGVVLDPFMGSGSTGKGAVLEGFQFVGIEQDAEYVAIARARIAAAVARSEALSLEQRVAWLETQVQAQGAKLKRIEASQQLSLFGTLG